MHHDTHIYCIIQQQQYTSTLSIAHSVILDRRALQAEWCSAATHEAILFVFQWTEKCSFAVCSRLARDGEKVSTWRRWRLVLCLKASLVNGKLDGIGSRTSTKVIHSSLQTLCISHYLHSLTPASCLCMTKPMKSVFNVLLCSAYAELEKHLWVQTNV